MVKLAVIYYSMYGHVKTLAETIKAGAETVPGVEVSIFQVSETLPQEVLTKMYAPPKADYPIIDPHTLPEYDGFIIGFPTRFGMMCAQMKAFFDTTGQLWQKGALVGKAVSFFTATAGQGGGQEVTIMSAVCHAAAHGMVYVPLGYTAGQGQFTLEEAKGGSPWGCGTYAGPTGQRQPSALELAEATQQGKLVAATTIKLAAK